MLANRKFGGGGYFSKNKGFVASALLYSLLILFLALILGILSMLSNRKMILDRLKSDIKGNITKVKLYKKYENGYSIYYNPVKGEICTDYSEDNSKTGVKEGCLKWYIFNDDGNKDTVNMILDHNTTASVAYNSTGKNTEMKEVKTALETDTKNWVNEARLISAEEIAEITNNKNWNSLKSTEFFYFETNTTEPGTTCNSNGECKYGWLFDRTNKACTNSGCYNDSDVSINGYWTSTKNIGKDNYVWNVGYGGSLGNALGGGDVTYTDRYGVRPVIEIEKSKIKSKFYIINLDPNEGTLNSKIKVYLENENYGKLPEPTKEGYKFAGWYTKKDGGEKITEEEIVKSNSTIYAHYTKCNIKSETNNITKYYLKLQDAINESSQKDQTTITLLDNITENIKVTTPLKSTILDLNNKKLNGNIINENTSSNITIKNGTINTTDIYILYNKGTMTIMNGNYITTNDTTSVKGINNYGTFYIRGGTITSPQGFTVNNFGKLYMYAGTIKHTKKGSNGTALFNNVNGVTRTTGGTIESTAYAFVNHSNLGTSDSSKQSILQNMNISITYSGGHITILNRNNSNTLTKHCVFTSLSSESILYNESGVLFSFDDDRKQSKTTKVVGIVYMYNKWPDGHVQITAFNRSDVTSFPTWSSNNGQDDIKWYAPTTLTDEQGTYQYVSVYKSNHNNDTGTYYTHIYSNSTFLAGFEYNMS